MALIPRLGPSTPPSSPANPSGNNSSSPPPLSANPSLSDMPYVKDPNLEKYAIDTSQYPNATKSLVGFLKGKRILVTYYRSLNRESNNRTVIADLPTARNIIDSEWQKIFNYEITLPKGFEFTTNQAQANMEITGQAYLYPGMNPNIGDIFTTATGDGRIGVCRVSNVNITSWRNDRAFVIDFLVIEFQDESNYAPIEDAVTLVSYFQKANYLGGTASLLSQDTYLYLQKIGVIRNNLCRTYHQNFFNTNICTYVRPDGVYDPWLVRFMSNKLSMDIIPVRPKNLYRQNDHMYQTTLWARLEDPYNNSLYGISPFYGLVGYKETRLSVFLTELNGRLVVEPTFSSNDGDPYLYSNNFYQGVVSQMTAEELLVFNAITQRSSGSLSGLIVNYLDTVNSLTPDEQFYKIPLYIHLIDMSLQYQYREADAPSISYASKGGE